MPVQPIIPPEWPLVYPIVVGQNWPQADEDAVRRCAQAWTDALAGLVAISGSGGQATQNVHYSVQAISTDEFDNYWKQYTAGDDSAVGQLAQQCQMLAEELLSFAEQTEFTKISIDIQIIILMIQLAWELLIAPATGGLSMGAAFASMFVAREVVEGLLFKLLDAVIMAVLPDLITQAVMVADGHRQDIDWGEAAQSAQMGLIGGLVGAGVGKVLGTTLENRLGKGLGGLLNAGVNGALTNVATNAAVSTVDGIEQAVFDPEAAQQQGYAQDKSSENPLNAIANGMFTGMLFHGVHQATEKPSVHFTTDEGTFTGVQTGEKTFTLFPETTADGKPHPDAGKLQLGTLDDNGVLQIKKTAGMGETYQAVPSEVQVTRHGVTTTSNFEDGVPTVVRTEVPSNGGSTFAFTQDGQSWTAPKGSTVAYGADSQPIQVTHVEGTKQTVFAGSGNGDFTPIGQIEQVSKNTVRYTGPSGNEVSPLAFHQALSEAQNPPAGTGNGTVEFSPPVENVSDQSAFDQNAFDASDQGVLAQAEQPLGAEGAGSGQQASEPVSFLSLGDSGGSGNGSGKEKLPPDVVPTPPVPGSQPTGGTGARSVNEPQRPQRVLRPLNESQQSRRITKPLPESQPGGRATRPLHESELEPEPEPRGYEEGYRGVVPEERPVARTTRPLPASELPEGALESEEFGPRGYGEGYSAVEVLSGDASGQTPGNDNTPGERGSAPSSPAHGDPLASTGEQQQLTEATPGGQVFEDQVGRPLQEKPRPEEQSQEEQGQEEPLQEEPLQEEPLQEEPGQRVQATEESQLPRTPSRNEIFAALKVETVEPPGPAAATSGQAGRTAETTVAAQEAAAGGDDDPNRRSAQLSSAQPDPLRPWQIDPTPTEAAEAKARADLAEQEFLEGLTVDRRHLFEQIRDQIVVSDQKVRGHLEDAFAAAKREGGGEGKLVGLDNFRKRSASIAEKIEKLPSERREQVLALTNDPDALLRSFSGDLNDLQRYTATFEVDGFVDSTLAHLRSLSKAGYRLFEGPDKQPVPLFDNDGSLRSGEFMKNFWQRGSRYNGLNATLVSPEGKVFELQYHTPESFRLKQNLTEDMYKVFSAGDRVQPVHKLNALVELIEVNRRYLKLPEELEKFGPPKKSTFDALLEKVRKAAEGNPYQTEQIRRMLADLSEPEDLQHLGDGESSAHPVGHLSEVPGASTENRRVFELRSGGEDGPVVGRVILDRTPSGWSLHSDDPAGQELAARAGAMSNDGRFVNIVAHATPDGFLLGDHVIPFRAVFDEIGLPPKDSVVRLIACEAGGGEAAAQLARELGRPVVAADRPVWLTKYGEVVSASPVDPEHDPYPRRPPDGVWTVYAPEASGSRELTAGDELLPKAPPGWETPRESLATILNPEPRGPEPRADLYELGRKGLRRHEPIDVEPDLALHRLLAKLTKQFRSGHAVGTVSFDTFFEGEAAQSPHPKDLPVSYASSAGKVENLVERAELNPEVSREYLHNGHQNVTAHHVQIHERRAGRIEYGAEQGVYDTTRDDMITALRAAEKTLPSGQELGLPDIETTINRESLQEHLKTSQGTVETAREAAAGAGQTAQAQALANLSGKIDAVHKALADLWASFDPRFKIVDLPKVDIPRRTGADGEEAKSGGDSYQAIVDRLNFFAGDPPSDHSAVPQNALDDALVRFVGWTDGLPHPSPEVQGLIAAGVPHQLAPVVALAMAHDPEFLAAVQTRQPIDLDALYRLAGARTELEKTHGGRLISTVAATSYLVVDIEAERYHEANPTNLMLLDMAKAGRLPLGQAIAERNLMAPVGSNPIADGVRYVREQQDKLSPGTDERRRYTLAEYLTDLKQYRKENQHTTVGSGLGVMEFQARERGILMDYARYLDELDGNIAPGEYGPAALGPLGMGLLSPSRQRCEDTVSVLLDRLYSRFGGVSRGGSPDSPA
ncbi:WXG100-like domain-containing protein [Rugosimonospora africana]|uniref:Outer membrane channel protein CpnT-like N-terminal domain-containing protein n=1 Tax=Rugosimonospora africana TaxID=556532 RepID=A0A8J3VU47_9ACTN|nr:hypothetical protein [Rugosimonospora africana]GIH18850.1 hypothetical protein Raf01_70220 [Rugosimonospora africana]